MNEANTTGQPQSQPQSTNQQQVQQTQQNQQNQQTQQTNVEGWSDDKFQAISDKYKGDPKEIAKALWSQQKEFSKFQQEFETLKKSSQSAKTENSSNNQKKTSPEPSAKKSDAQTVEEKGDLKITPQQVVGNVYVEAFEQGQISQASIKQLKDALGLDEADASIFAEAMSGVIAKRTKEAQAYVETDVKELKKFAEADGNFTDQELFAIQEALNRGYYGVLKDVEKRYKASQKKTVEHGNGVVGTTTGAGLTFEAAEKMKQDMRYGRDRAYTQGVEDMINSADKSGWIDEVKNKYASRR